MIGLCNDLIISLIHNQYEYNLEIILNLIVEI